MRAVWAVAARSTRRQRSKASASTLEYSQHSVSDPGTMNAYISNFATLIRKRLN